MQSDDEEQWISPSFNSYSQTKSAEIVGKVAGEAAGDAQLSLPTISENLNYEDEEDIFQFAFIEDQQPPNFPIFNREEN